MAVKDELGSGWVHNPNPLLKPERDEEPPEDNPLDERCPKCQMPMWMCECEQ